MKLIIIRHCEPDYSTDTLTQKGLKEAVCLQKRLDKTDIIAAYSSPLGRAKLTAQISLQNKQMQFEVCDWLQEFSYPVINPINNEKMLAWDLMPEFYAKNRQLDEKNWYNDKLFDNSLIASKYAEVCSGLDKLLAKHGYVHENNYYTVVNRNADTIALFCHFGVECVLISHILNISPYPFFQGFCALTSSVTTFVTEERQEGKASFRCIGFGDISHLYAQGEPPSFCARFCERYDDGDRR